jgi:hypothetical protein
MYQPECDADPDICQACGERIKIMVRRGTDFCSTDCEKRTRMSDPWDTLKGPPAGRDRFA